MLKQKNDNNNDIIEYENDKINSRRKLTWIWVIVQFYSYFSDHYYYLLCYCYY